MRPGSIIGFERLNIATILLGIVQSWMSWDAMVKATPPIMVLIVQSFTVALLLGLTLLVSRRRSKVAMWIFIIFFVLGIPVMIAQIASGMFDGSFWLIAVQTLVQAAALGLLFTPSARDWMNRRMDGEGLRETFS